MADTEPQSDLDPKKAGAFAERFLAAVAQYQEIGHSASLEQDHEREV